MKIKFCIECEKPNSNYKCPKCRALYCSVGCFKKHKLNCSCGAAKTETQLPGPALQNVTGSELEVKDNPVLQIDSILAHRIDPVSAFLADAGTGNNDRAEQLEGKCGAYPKIVNAKTFDEGDQSKFSNLTTTDLIDGADIQPGVVLLTEKQKHALQQCTELRSILRSKRLREDIHQVESSKDRRAALQQLRARKPEFDAFLSTVMDTIQSYEYAEHQSPTVSHQEPGLEPEQELEPQSQLQSSQLLNSSLTENMLT